MVAVVAVILVVALIGGVLAALGGLFSSGGVSKEEFIPQADAICRDTGEQTATLEPPTDLPSIGEFFSAVTPLLEEETSAIKALESPEEDKETLDAWIATHEELAGLFSSAADAGNSGDQQGFDSAFTEVNTVQAESGRLAAEYGFRVCGISAPS